MTDIASLLLKLSLSADHKVSLMRITQPSWKLDKIFADWNSEDYL